MKDKLDLILDNQRLIMRSLRGTFNHHELAARENVILIELNPKEEPPIQDKTKEAMDADASRSKRE